MGFAVAGLAASATVFATQANQQAQAASGDALLLGNSNLASDKTYISQTGSFNSSDGAIFWADWNPTVQSTAPATSVKAAIAGTSSEGVGGYFQGSNAPILLAPAASTGAPTTGTHAKGELYVDSAGGLYICQGNGTPGTWVKVYTSNVVILDAVARIIDDQTQRAASYSVTLQVTGVNTLDSTKLLPSNIKSCFFKVSLLASSATGATPGGVGCIVQNPNYLINATSLAGYVDVPGRQVTGMCAATLNSSGQVLFSLTAAGGTNRFVVDVVGYIL
jgi:hypothetical protein